MLIATFIYDTFLIIISCHCSQSRPLRVPITVCLVSIGTMCFSVDILPVAIIAQMLMSTFNDVSVSYLNELIATSVPPSKFRKNQGRG